MTAFLIKSLTALGVVLYLGGPMEALRTALGIETAAAPHLVCTQDFGSCRVAEVTIPLGDRSPAIARMAKRAAEDPLADLRRSLADRELGSVLDERVVPVPAVEAGRRSLERALTRLAAGAEGVGSEADGQLRE